MKLDGHKLGLTAAATSAILFTACSIIMHLWPQQSLDLSAALFHLSSFGPLMNFFEMSARVYVSGVIQTALYSYIYVQLFVFVYNYLGKKR